MPRPARHRRTPDRVIAAVVGAAALLVALGGCTRLRLPAIDPTGRCLFSPFPTTTTLATPPCGLSDGCVAGPTLQKIRDCLTRPAIAFPTPNLTPVFTEPPEVPPCPTPPSPAAATCGIDGCVPSEPCTGDCVDGPPAVLYGTEIDCRPCLGGKHHLPPRGKRGCILLTPQTIVAPVGGEVILLSGICGTDGYLQMNERLEWMVAPGGVGQIIDVADNPVGAAGRLAGIRVRPEKLDPGYAIGVTSNRRQLITRGNKNPADDIRLEKGQTWASISSPLEGVSHVTVLAPDSECWDRRRATATIYWVDARWSFPPPQVLPAGTPATLTTRVLRSKNGLPAEGWKVRYEIVDASTAAFTPDGVGTGTSFVEAIVDANGDATATLVPAPETRGTVPVEIRIIRPGGRDDDVPTLTLGRGQTFVTWSAPGLAIRAAGPEVATYDAAYNVVAEISNPGDQTATNVRVDMPLPAGTTVVSADSFARVTPSSVSWDIGELPAQTALDLPLTLRSTSAVSLPFTARADGLVAESVVRVDVFQPSLTLDVAPVQPSVESGRPARFNVDITNNGSRPLSNVTWVATGDASMLHESGNVAADNTLERPLQPGETWPVEVTFIPNQSGRRCIDVVATADGGQRADGDACVTAINPIPDVPQLQVRFVPIDDGVRVGDDPAIYRFDVVNRGRGPATGVTVAAVYDRQFAATSATEGADTGRIGENLITWRVARLDPGATETFEVVLSPTAASPGARIAASAESVEGTRDEDAVTVRIDATTTPPSRDRSPDLPPAGPSPTIPGGPAPLRGAPPRRDAPAPAAPPRPQRLEAALFQVTPDPVRVNDPIRYTLEVVNDSDRRDYEIDIQFIEPDGVRIERIVGTTTPESTAIARNAGVVTFEPIAVLNPGERAEFQLVLRSNQPQTFELDTRIRSLNDPTGTTQSIVTRVVP